MLDLRLVELLATELGTNPSLIEKDWHVIRALGVIASIADENVRPVFSGGTSLAKGWNLIRRFSEDIDFKVIVTADTKAASKKIVSAWRIKMLDAMTAAGFVLEGEPVVGNASLFFRAHFNYGGKFEPSTGQRPTLRVEMTFISPVREPVERPLRSLMAEAQRADAEIAAFPCVDPVETAADKIAALSWRTYVRDRKGQDDDPTIVRHIHDLAALARLIEDDAAFVALAGEALAADAKRTKDSTISGSDLARRLVPAIQGDPIWREEYERFVSQVSYATAAEAISFEKALAACERLIERLIQEADKIKHGAGKAIQ